jgi:hypothetical protein
MCDFLDLFLDLFLGVFCAFWRGEEGRRGEWELP